MGKEKTIQDFNKAVLEAKQEFLNEKMNYNWNYTIKTETFEHMECFWICNFHHARKIIFNKELKFVLDREIYMSDLDVLSEMKGELNK
jgi:hypothetical protein